MLTRLVLVQVLSGPSEDGGTRQVLSNVSGEPFHCDTVTSVCLVRVSCLKTNTWNLQQHPGDLHRPWNALRDAEAPSPWKWHIQAHFSLFVQVPGKAKHTCWTGDQTEMR